MIQRPSLRACLLVLCLPLVAATAACCATRGPEAAAGRPAQAGAAEAEAVADSGADAELERALGEALGGGELPEPARIETECLTGDGFYELRLYGSGVGVWQRRAQVEVATEELREALGLFRRHRFAELEESYGGKADPKTPAAAIRVVCSVALTLGDAEKRVTQLDGGRQSAELRALAEALLGRFAERGEAGTRVESLADGLRGLAAGELAPETLELLFHLKREGAGEGVLLRVAHGRATARPYGTDGALGGEVRRGLGERTIRDLAGDLAAAEVAGLPLNLHSDDYVDLRADVLGHERALQARRFANLDAATHGDAQRAFDRLVERLEELAGAVLGGAGPEDVAER